MAAKCAADLVWASTLATQSYLALLNKFALNIGMNAFIISAAQRKNETKIIT